LSVLGKVWLHKNLHPNLTNSPSAAAHVTYTHINKRYLLNPNIS